MPRFVVQKAAAAPAQSRRRLSRGAASGRTAVEGAGVHLRRASGYGQHPHRGIETITHMLEGEVKRATGT